LFKHYFPSRFPSLWNNYNALIESNRIISVREVYGELFDQKDDLAKWCKDNRTLFPDPSIDEMEFVIEIFRTRNFQDLINTKQRLRPKPVADPFIIAKAKALNGCVVTEEKLKPNAAKIPNICLYFSIDCCNLEAFMEREGWTF
jgi:hypothetical protein